MLTYTGSRNLFGKLTNNESTANLTLGDTLINRGTKKILSLDSWSFIEDTSTTSTVSQQQAYDLPYNCKRLLGVKVTIGTTNYYPKQSPSLNHWLSLNQNTADYSDTPEWYYVLENQLNFYPIPSSATTNAITFIFEKSFKNLSIADYTTGTITSIANGAAAVVGSGTSWTAKMVGSYISITDSQSANTGDGYWYEISAVASATALTLDKVYGGISIAAGSAAYTIGQVSPIPEDFQDSPIFWACWVYFTSIQPNATKAKLYKELLSDDIDIMKKEYGSKGGSPVIENIDEIMFNPNLTVQL